MGVKSAKTLGPFFHISVEILNHNTTYLTFFSRSKLLLILIAQVVDIVPFPSNQDLNIQSNTLALFDSTGTFVQR